MIPMFRIFSIGRFACWMILATLLVAVDMTSDNLFSLPGLELRLDEKRRRWLAESRCLLAQRALLPNPSARAPHGVSGRTAPPVSTPDFPVACRTLRKTIGGLK